MLNSVFRSGNSHETLWSSFMVRLRDTRSPPARHMVSEDGSGCLRQGVTRWGPACSGITAFNGQIWIVDLHVLQQLLDFDARFIYLQPEYL